MGLCFCFLAFIFKKPNKNRYYSSVWDTTHCIFTAEMARRQMETVMLQVTIQDLAQGLLAGWVSHLPLDLEASSSIGSGKSCLALLGIPTAGSQRAFPHIQPCRAAARWELGSFLFSF